MIGRAQSYSFCAGSSAIGVSTAMFYELEWVVQQLMVMLTSGDTKSPIKRPFSVAKLDLIWTVQEPGMSRMPNPIYLSKASGIPSLLAMASTLQGHQLPITFFFIGFNHRVPLGKGIILDPRYAGVLIREDFPFNRLTLMLGSNSSTSPLKLV